MKKILLSAIATAALLALSGCSGDSESSLNTSKSSTLQVERGPVLGAVVVDSNGSQAVEGENGAYTFSSTPVYPVTAYGGYIDVNRNGVIDAGEVENTVVLKAEDGEVLTLLTSLLSSNDANISTILLDDLGLNSALTPGESTDVAAVSDVIYKYLIDNNISDVSDVNFSEFNQTISQIKLKIEEYEQSDLNASEQESILVLELEIDKLDDADADDANKKIKGQNAIDVITNLPDGVMTPEQKQHVLDMIAKHDKGLEVEIELDDGKIEIEIELDSDEDDNSTDSNTTGSDDSDDVEEDKEKEKKKDKENKNNDAQGNGKGKGNTQSNGNGKVDTEDDDDDDDKNEDEDEKSEEENDDDSVIVDSNTTI